MDKMGLFLVVLQALSNTKSLGANSRVLALSSKRDESYTRKEGSAGMGGWWQKAKRRDAWKGIPRCGEEGGGQEDGVIS